MGHRKQHYFQGKNKMSYYLPTATDATRKFRNPAIREAALNRANYRCQGCGCGTNLELDHWFPHHKGGKTSLANCAVLCGECNKAKGKTVPTQDAVPHVFPIQDMISTIETKRLQEHFKSLVATWRKAEQDFQVEFGKEQRKQGRTVRSILNQLLISSATAEQAYRAKLEA